MTEKILLRAAGKFQASLSGAVATCYRSKVEAYQIWSEPKLNSVWGRIGALRSLTRTVRRNGLWLLVVANARFGFAYACFLEPLVRVAVIRNQVVLEVHLDLHGEG
jgi:hypothetical protein